MIKKVLIENKLELERNSILKSSYENAINELEKDSKEYYIGVDIADPNFTDHSVMAYFTVDENGVVTLEGIKRL